LCADADADDDDDDDDDYNNDDDDDDGLACHYCIGIMFCHSSAVSD
jgi:hypothetical protein